MRTQTSENIFKNKLYIIIQSLVKKVAVMVSVAFEVQELINENRVCQNDISSLQQWLEEEDSVPKISDKQIATFLMACANNLDATKKCIQHYYLTRKNAPEIFNNRNIVREEMIQQLKAMQFAIIPKRTSDNTAIILYRVSDSNPSLFHMDVALKLLFMCYDSFLYDNPPNGVIVLVDMKSITLGFIPRMKLSSVKIASHYIQESMPLKTKEIHVMNVNWYIDQLLAILKPFLNKEFMRKLHLHLPDKMEDIYENHVPKSHLPNDYGGELPPIQELHEQTIKRLESLTIYFEEEEKQRNDFYDKLK